MRHHYARSHWSGLILIAALSLLTGCGGSSGPVRNYADVTGTVKYRGKPLTMGKVMFQPPTGAMDVGDIKPDGTYTLKGVIGPNIVTIVSRDPEPDVKAARAAGKQVVEAKSHIPDKYGTPKSGLNFEVKAGKNTADFDLQ